MNIQSSPAHMHGVTDLRACPDFPWWKGATIYQIYPRSFADSNGDGIGDLPGITAKLDHVADLGAEAIWISPFFTSPMKDFGYDVADFCDVDPIFGTLADFDALVARAHSLGLKVLIDQVYSHSSDQCAWFEESRQSRDNPKADWYVWADPKPDGSPPTNWQSVFGGPAWQWDARRRQYYLHNFLTEQPDLNVHNPVVQEALLGVARFWLDRGVDGFRIDALNFAMHDLQFRDNPPAPDDGRVKGRPFDYQLRQYNQGHLDIVKFIERIRGVMDDYGATFSVAEVGGDESEREMKLYTEGGKRLNSAYGFDFLYAPALTASAICETLAKWPDEAGVGWPSWAFENHDAPRAVSRWVSENVRSDAALREAFLRLKMALLVSLRGNIILYYGEELGLDQVDIPFDRLQDPEAIANWPLTLSRDGARTPMPWDAGSNHLGFGSGEPWLPTGESHAARAVNRQASDAASLLNLTRELLTLRNSQRALRWGTMTCIDTGGDDVLAFTRVLDGEAVTCVFNLTEEPAAWPKAVAAGAVLTTINGAAAGEELPPFGAVMMRS